jgi:flavin-dependent dehydrogenase
MHVLTAPDVVVIGGGTAGAAAARLLASWGHQVLMVERELSRQPLAESLPPSCIPLLERIGVRDAIDAAGFVRGRGNTVWWGGEPMRVEHFPGGGLGYQVARDQLERVLGRCAEDAGVTRLHPATVLRVDRVDAHHDVTLSTADGHRVVRAKWVLDCSGRAGLLARAYRVAPAATVRTIALVGIWDRDDAWPVPDDTHTLVESTEWGWGWSVPLTPTTRCFTAMVDPHATPLVGEDGLVSRYDALFAALPALGPILRGARRTLAPWACEATPYHSREVALPGTLFVGDAASMIDPLSSFGVKKALASAWLAAVVVHTGLVTPEHEEAAKTLYREREAAYVHSAAQALSGVSRSAEGGRDAPFWSARAEQQATDARDESEMIARLRADPAVLQAFADLRDRPRVRLEADPLLPRVQRPVVRGNVVVPVPHVLLHGEHEAVRYLRSIDCLELLEVAATSDDVGAMYARYARRAGPVPLPDFLGALSVLVAKGALRLA